MINFPDGPLFIHSGIRRALHAVQAAGTPLSNDVKETLYKFLLGSAHNEIERLIFPAFNYDYGRTRNFKVDSDAVQVGSFPEFVRRRKPFVRSEIPFFSFLSSQCLGLSTDGVINPFGSKSGFNALYEKDATLVFAGADLHSITFIHFVEEISGGPLYRYEKNFPGKITVGSEERKCDFRMHVRPLGVHMDYDWPRLAKELQTEGIMKFYDDSVEIFFLNTQKLTEFWGNKISENPLYLLDAESLSHFAPATNGGKRRVTIEEYENA